MAASGNDTMNPEEWQRAKDIFSIASELSPDTREAYLAETCGQNHNLYCEVKSLLQSLEQAGSFLQPPPASTNTDEPTSSHRSTLSVGQVIAKRFQILRFVGSGG